MSSSRYAVPYRATAYIVYMADRLMRRLSICGRPTRVHHNMAMKLISNRSEIYPVFRQLFEKTAGDPPRDLANGSSRRSQSSFFAMHSCLPTEPSVLMAVGDKGRDLRFILVLDLV